MILVRIPKKGPEVEKQYPKRDSFIDPMQPAAPSSGLCTMAEGEPLRLLAHQVRGLDCAIQTGSSGLPEFGAEGIYWAIWLRGHAVLHDRGRVWRLGRHDTITLVPGGGTPVLQASACSQRIGLWLCRQHLDALAGDEGSVVYDALRQQRVPQVIPARSDILRTVTELIAVLDCPTNGRLLRDAKCLELLARLLQTPLTGATPALTRTQRIRVRQAHELLLADLAHPPSVPELARACGLNAHRLKQGFREVYGQSIRATYQAARMRHAWQLITKEQLSVSAAGQLVGYTNLSHFSAAFHRHFGLMPGELKRCANRTN